MYEQDGIYTEGATRFIHTTFVSYPLCLYMSWMYAPEFAQPRSGALVRT